MAAAQKRLEGAVQEVVASAIEAGGAKGGAAGQLKKSLAGAVQDVVAAAIEAGGGKGGAWAPPATSGFSFDGLLPRAAASTLSEIEDFGANPGNLRMLAHVPEGLELRGAAGGGPAWLHADGRRLRPRLRLVGAGRAVSLRPADARATPAEQSQSLLQLVRARAHASRRGRPASIVTMIATCCAPTASTAVAFSSSAFRPAGRWPTPCWRPTRTCSRAAP